MNPNEIGKSFVFFFFVTANEIIDIRNLAEGKEIEDHYFYAALILGRYCATFLY